MPRTSSDKQPALLQYSNHTKFETVFGLSLPDLLINWSDLHNSIYHFLYDKLIELGAEDLATLFLTLYAILEVTQYEFNTEYLTDTPKHVRPPCTE